MVDKIQGVGSLINDGTGVINNGLTTITSYLVKFTEVLNGFTFGEWGILLLIVLILVGLLILREKAKRNIRKTRYY